jgi:hypothetical protein
MANNLFISYDLMSPGQRYDSVIEVIKGLGSWAKVHQSLWYVNSAHAAASAAAAVWAVMDANDKLIVVDATNNAASWYGDLSEEVRQYIRDQWLK